MTAKSLNTSQVDVERRSGGFAMPEDHHVIKLFSGDCYVTDKPKSMLVTILGSCISACIRDPQNGIGGMNHFLLPHGEHRDIAHTQEATRYGAYAMEQLINGIIKLGGSKGRLEVKLFGGGNVIKSNTLIGHRNVEFVKDFMKKEGLLIAGSDLGGDYPRRIHYFTDTGKVMMRNLQRKEDLAVVEEEKRFAASLETKPIEGDVDLF